MIGAIVLAAGRSARMGTQKLLLPWNGKPLIAHIVDELACSPVDRIVTVLGSDAEAVRIALAHPGVEFVRNPDATSDMLASVRCGLRALPDSCAAVLVALGDQPGITRQLVAGLINEFHRNRRGIVVPVHDRRHGHPLLFSARYRDEVLTRFDGVGLRGLLRSHSDDVCEHAVDMAGVLDDIDTPADYERMQSERR